MHVRIRRSGLRIALGLGECAQSSERYLGIDKLARDIELHIRDALGIGRPPVSRTQIQLFGIDPIQFAIQQRGAAVIGEPRKLACSDIERVQVMSTPKRHAQAIGGKLGVAFGLGRGRELFPRAAVDGKKKQVATHAQ